MKTTADPVFVAFAKSAPRLDLQFYLRYAGRHQAAYSRATRAIVSDMLRLEVALTLPKAGSVASQKRAVWTLIDRFKASIDGWSDAAPGVLAEVASPLRNHGLVPRSRSEPLRIVPESSELGVWFRDRDRSESASLLR